jgi:hypothetical protein
MVEIREVEGRIEVVANDYCEVFRTRAKAVMAAHFLAEGQAAGTAEPVQIRVPNGWGDPIVVGT